MSRTRLRLLFLQAAPVLAFLALVGVAIAAPEAPPPVPPPQEQIVPGQYIVIFKKTTTEAQRPQIQRRVPAQVDAEYRHAVKGFAGRMSAADAQQLRGDPNVTLVAPVHVIGVQAQTTPTGVARIGGGPFFGANINTNADVAIVDTGIDPTHPDLNVVGGVGLWPPSGSCSAPSTSFADDYGHGTAVAGVAAARDNSDGVVGVAPGARLWSVKALNCHASGTDASLLAGIDWIAGRKQEYDNGAVDGDAGINFGVANFSVGGVTSVDPSQDPLCLAIADSVAAGVTYVAAAGNANADASTLSPVHCPTAIAVSAIVDSDGKPGHLGPTTTAGPDDTFANFSNFGSVVKIAAPGVNIMTTTMGGGYTGLIGFSGTSASAPHVAGAVALLRAATLSLTPDQVLSALLAKASPQNGFCGFSGDPSPEPLLSLDGCKVTELRLPSPVFNFGTPGNFGVTGDTSCPATCPTSRFWPTPPAGVASERPPH